MIAINSAVIGRCYGKYFSDKQIRKKHIWTYKWDTKSDVKSEKGVLENKLTTTGKTSKGFYHYDSYKATTEQGTMLFEFAANNKDVEFSILKFNDGNSYVSTTHMPGAEAGAMGLLNNPILKLNSNNLIEFTHSHPGGVKAPSGLVPEGVEEDRDGDIPIAQSLIKRAPNVIFTIYTATDKQYTPFKSTDKLPPLEPVIVTPKKKKKINNGKCF